MNYPKIVKISESIIENKNVKTLKFKYNKKMEPGQFFMIWIPEVDEIPMSVSYIDKKIKGITFKNVGNATKALFNFQENDRIGVRGPYGNAFKIIGKNILFVGGGMGIAVLTPAFEKVQNKNISSTYVIGMKSKYDIFFEDRIKNNNAKIYYTTDDGSKGYKGLATDILKNLLLKNKFSSIITCGPEIMMKKILDLSDNISFQASLERYMKCGVGLCSQCCIGEGLRVCLEGSIFNGKTLKNIDDFGVYKRDASGKRIEL
jgi:dihydroorotate dehydrogenase electron transfer subunit